MAAEREKDATSAKSDAVAAIKAGGGYEAFWKVKNVAVALSDSDTDFRCKDCFGAVKLLGRNGKNGTVPYVEHKLATDAEFCPSGLLFKRAAALSREPLAVNPARPE